MGGTLNEPGAGPGSALRTEREAMGVTLREVSETLNLSIAVIQAIEENDYPRLPRTVFVRGYVRAYARLLGLAPEPLVAQAPVRNDPATATRLSADQPYLDRLSRRPGLVLGAIGLLVLLAVIFGLQWWPVVDEADTPSALLPQREQTDALLDDTPWTYSELDDPPVILPPVALAESGNPVVAQNGGISLAATSVQAEQMSVSTPLRLTATGEDRLSLRFTGDCWVQVRDASGADLYSDLRRAGDDLELVGQAPLRILVGNAPGAQLAFNGELVPLGPHTRNNVATLVLGH
jgi:cytoskeleton protein RodZ